MVDGCMKEMGGDRGALRRHRGQGHWRCPDGGVRGAGRPRGRLRAGRRGRRLRSSSARSSRPRLFGGLCVRVGVNTGEVIFAPVGPGRREFTVMGDTVNTAARLQAAAPPEGVLLGEQTHAACTHAIACEAMEPILAKGKEAPLRAWLARWATSAPADRPLSAAPFLGRDAELELLVRAWARTSGELHPQLVTLVGPPGIGKTRLTREFAARVESGRGTDPARPPAPVRRTGRVLGLWSGRQGGVRDLRNRRARRRGAQARRAYGLAAAFLRSARAGEEPLDPGSPRRGHCRGPAGAVRLCSALPRGACPRAAHAGGARGPALGRRQPRGARRGALRAPCGSAAAPARNRPAGVPRRTTDVGTAPDQRHRAGSGPHRLLRARAGAPTARQAVDQEALARRVERAAGGNPLFIEELAAWLSEGGAAGWRAPGEPQGDHRCASRPAARARAAGDPRRVRGRRLLLAGQPAGARRRRLPRGYVAVARAPRPDPPQPVIADRRRPGADLQARAGPRGRLRDPAEGRPPRAPRGGRPLHRARGGRPERPTRRSSRTTGARPARARAPPTTCSSRPRPGRQGMGIARGRRALQPGARADPGGRQGPPATRAAATGHRRAGGEHASIDVASSDQSKSEGEMSPPIS